MRKKWLCLIATMFISIGALTWIKREEIKQHIINYVVEKIALETGYSLAFEEIELLFPGEFNVKHLEVTTHDGSLVKIQKLNAVVNVWELLRKQVVLKNLQIDDLELFAIPSSSQASLSKSTILLIFDAIPFNFAIESFDFHHIKTPFEIPLNIKGQMRIDSTVANSNAKKCFLELIIAPTEQLQNQTQATLFIEQTDTLAEIQLRLIESDNAILATRFNLPKGYSFQGTFQASGTCSAWQHLIEKSEAEKEDLINGYIQLACFSTRSDNKNIDTSWFSILSPFTLSTTQNINFLNIEGICEYCQLEGKLCLSSNGDLGGTRFKIYKISPYKLINWIKADDIEIAVELKGNWQTPQANLKMQSQACNLKEFCFEQITLDSELNYNEMGLLQGDFTTSFKYDKRPVHAYSTISWTGDPHLQLSKIRITSSDAELLGDLKINTVTLTALGELEGTLPLSYLQPKINGMCTFRSNLFLEGSIQAIETSLDASQVVFENSSFESISLRTTLLNPYEKPSGSLKFSCWGASCQNYQFAQIECETEIAKHIALWPFAISLRTVPENQLDLHTTGFWHQSANELHIVLDAFSGSIIGNPFFLQIPLTLHIDNEINFSPLHLNVGDGILKAVTSSDPTRSLNIHAHHFPLELIKFIRPDLSVPGFFDAEVQLKELGKELTGDMQLEFKNVKLPKFADSSEFFLNGVFAASLYQNSLKCTGQVKGFGPIPIEVNATVPMQATLSPLKITIDRNDPISIHLMQNGQIESILELIMPASTPQVTGQTVLSIDVAGTLNDPIINGNLKVENGTFEIVDIGLAFQGIKGRAAINGNKLVITELNSHGFQCQGMMELDLTKGCPFELAIQLDKVPLAPLNYASLIAGGNLSLKGDMQQLLLQGKIIAEELNITIPEEIPALTNTVEVIYINQPENVLPPTLVKNASSTWPILLNLDFEIPRKGIIKGKDWTSEWKGRVVATGTTEAPLLHGTCKIIQGEYRFNGKGFNITEGSISFAGEADKKTSLYIIASQDLGEITAEIILKGPIKHPAISFRSNPPLPQREIVSWILFNRGISEITPFQGTQLNESITNLDTSGKTDMLTKLRNRIGIDRIDINRGENGTSNEVSVQVGKYISHGIFVAINKSVSSEANRVSIEANLMRNVKVQAEIGDDAAGQLLLKWKHDY